MRRILTLTAGMALFVALGLAETMSGRLIDTTCLQQPKPTVSSCQPKADSTTFALLDSSGKVYKFDESGNAKTASAMKNRADRSADPSSTANAPVVIQVTGTVDGNTIKVETIQVQ